MEEYSKLNDSIYWHDDEGIYVNLFIPSELNWADKGLKLRQENNFPQQQSTALTITVGQAAGHGAAPSHSGVGRGRTVKINGKPVEVTAEPGSYLSIHRTWKTGDRVEMTLPMRLSVEAMPDDPATQAFLYGPLVLAGDLGNEGLTERTDLRHERAAQCIALPAPARRREPAVRLPRPSRSPRCRQRVPIRRRGSSRPKRRCTFHTVGQKKDVTLRPINSIFDKRYSVYWTVS